jgi:hypothetical protein
MSFTARVGQFCAAVGRADSANATTAMTEPSRGLATRMTFPQGRLWCGRFCQSLSKAAIL